MGILDTVKQTIDRLTGEEARRQERELKAQQQREDEHRKAKAAAAQRVAAELAAEKAQQQQLAAARDQAKENREQTAGPMARLWGGELPPPLPEPQKAIVPTRLEHTRISQPGPTMGGQGRPVRNDRVQEPQVAQPVQEDIYDRTMRRRLDVVKIEESRRAQLTPKERQAEDQANELLKELERAKRGTVVLAYETGLSMTRVRE